MSSKSGVYTKTGDKGTTALVGGKRVPKNHIRIDCYGTIDELNSFVGLLMAEELLDDTQMFLLKLQHRLFNVGGNLATDPDVKEYVDATRLVDEDVQWVEREIDRLDEGLPMMRAFVLPSGGRSASLCHVCRTICRRAERLMYSLAECSTVDPITLKFVNRLSDYFFVLGRSECHRAHGRDIEWNQNLLKE